VLGLEDIQPSECNEERTNKKMDKEISKQTKKQIRNLKIFDFSKKSEFETALVCAMIFLKNLNPKLHWYVP
jgi:hypothetical protein